MIIMGLDPSSTRTGYAVLRGPKMAARDWKLLDAGVLTPRRVRDEAEERIDAMIADLRRVLDKHRPDVIVIEMPSGRPGLGSRRGARSSLAIYGVAAGEIRRFVKCWCWSAAVIVRGRDEIPEVVSVLENEWTRRVPKRRRQALIAARYPHYKPKDDPGGDAADAIGVVHWWLEQREELTPRRQGAARKTAGSGACSADSARYGAPGRVPGRRGSMRCGRVRK